MNSTCVLDADGCYSLQSLVIFYKLAIAVHDRAVDSSREYPTLVDD
jgi:hypothetical protein